MESARESLASTKRIHSEMKQHEQRGDSVSTKTLSEWKCVVASANKELSKILKKMSSIEERHRVEVSIVNEELRSELVDREANGVRIAERFRMILEREGNSSQLDRAINSTSVVEASIAALCPNASGVGLGTVTMLKVPKIASYKRERST